MSQPNASPTSPAANSPTSTGSKGGGSLAKVDLWVAGFVAVLAVAVLVHGFMRAAGFGADVVIGFVVVLGPGLLVWSRVRAQRTKTEATLAELAASNAKISAQSASLAIAKSETDRIITSGDNNRSDTINTGSGDDLVDTDPFDVVEDAGI